MPAPEYNVAGIINHWPVWFVTVTLVVAAVIDGRQLKVPNWLTFPFVISGWIYSFATFGVEGLLWSLGGTVVGLALLLPAYAIGGMGAGDVKLLAGVGAWMHATHTFWGFVYAVIIGAVIAVVMVPSIERWASGTAGESWFPPRGPPPPRCRRLMTSSASRADDTPSPFTSRNWRICEDCG